jgi:hypothetical protein
LLEEASCLICADFNRSVPPAVVTGFFIRVVVDLPMAMAVSLSWRGVDCVQPMVAVVFFFFFSVCP